MTWRSSRSPATSADLEESTRPQPPPPASSAAPTPPWVERLRRNQLAACLAYSACSVSMVLANKAIALNGGQQAAADGALRVLPVAFQNMCTVVLLEALRSLDLVKYSWMDQQSARASAPLGACFIAMLLTGFMSLKHLSVPLVTVFKNMTNLLIVVGEWRFYQQPVSSGVLWSLAVMIAGAVLAAHHDLSFSPQGYCWMAFNCLATAGYVLYLKRVTRAQSLSRFSVVFFNNAVSLALLLLVALSTGELADAVAPSDGGDGGASAGGTLPAGAFWCLTVATGLVAFMLNFASLWCVGATSATTYAIVGSMNKVPVVLLGHVVFRTVLSPESWFFVAISIAGGFLYSQAKLKEDKLKNKNKSKTDLADPLVKR